MFNLHLTLPDPERIFSWPPVFPGSLIMFSDTPLPEGRDYEVKDYNIDRYVVRIMACGGCFNEALIAQEYDLIKIS